MNYQTILFKLSALTYIHKSMTEMYLNGVFNKTLHMDSMFIAL